MSEGVKTEEEKAAEARRGPARRGGPPHMTLGQPAEKSLDFWPSAKRLLRRLRPTTASLAAYPVGVIRPAGLPTGGQTGRHWAYAPAIRSRSTPPVHEPLS